MTGLTLCVALATALSHGNGDDTTPAWSQDGTKIAYVSDATGKSELYILDAKSHAASKAEIGEGEAFQPVWTPDGAVVFSKYKPNGTAFQTKKDLTATLWKWKDGKAAPLSSDKRPGRDYTPVIAPDGTVWCTTTRGLDQTDTVLGKIDRDGNIVKTVGIGIKEEGYVSPTLSPDGKVVAYAYLSGLYGSWRIAASPVAEPEKKLCMTQSDAYAYAPKFSPSGKYIAYTGYRPGEIGWGIFVQDVYSGENWRLDTGLAGNSRSPAWSPDGKRIVFENNSSGKYKIYAMDFRDPVPGSGILSPEDALPEKFVKTDTMDFGPRDFTIKLKVKVDSHKPGDYIFFLRAEYDTHPLGIQIYLDAHRNAIFSTRRFDGIFVMAKDEQPFPLGREVELLCVKEKSGKLSLFVDGKSAGFGSPGRMISLDHCKKIEKDKTLLSMELHTGAPEFMTGHALRSELFPKKQEQAASRKATRGPFELIAFADSLDFNHVMDTEVPEENLKCLEHMLETGADTVLWRTGAGSTTRHPSQEEPRGYCPAELRRLPDNRQWYGFLRYPDAQPDIYEYVKGLCKERGVRWGNHSPFEETHWTSWTFGIWNAEHPQYWSRNSNGEPWAGRCSLAFDEVVAHKLRAAEEILDYGTEIYYLDTWRNGGWDHSLEFVEPELRRWREKYGNKPAVMGAEWRAHVAETTTRFIRALSATVRARGAKFFIGVGHINDTPGEDVCMKRFGHDWRRYVDEGLIDGLVVMYEPWDVKRPFESTREIYRRIRLRCGDKCGVYFPVASYDFENKGIPTYMKATGKSFADVAETLLRIAYEEGGAGATMECVDWNNYPKAARERIRSVAAQLRKESK